MSAYLDHIGIAVREDSRLAEALTLLGLKIAHKERVEREKVDAEFLPLPLKQGNIELLHATESDSTIGKFVDKLGRDGIHHLSFRVDDIRETSARLVSAGFRLIYPEAKTGAHGCLVNFLHPGTTGGVLIEISEKTGK